MSAPQPYEPDVTQKASTLECLECGRRCDTGRRWRAYLFEEREVWIYCADCAAREFDDTP